MEVHTIHSAGRTHINIFRLLDGSRRAIRFYVPAGWSLARVYAGVLDQLTNEEALEVARAFGLREGPGEVIHHERPHEP